MIPSFSTIFAFPLVTVLGLAATSASAEDWPQFRGLGGNASVAKVDLPLHWSGTKNMVWKTSLPGRGSSSPVVWGDRIYLTAFTGFGTPDTSDKSKLRLHVICFDRNNGTVNWDRSVAASPLTQNFTKRIQDHGYATSTPTTDGEAVYAFFGVSGVVAYDMSGKLLWRGSVGTRTSGFGSAASPVLFNDLLIVNGSIESDSLIAFDKRTGQRVWTVPRLNKAWTTPCIAKLPDGSHELVINQKEAIYGLDPWTGKQLWHCNGIQDYVVPVPVAHDGVVYCLGGRQNRCIAVQLGGRGDVTDSHKLWEVNIGANVTSPVYYNGHLYWASDKAIANCLNAKTGEAVYRERLNTRSRIYASIVRAGDRLLVTTRDHGIMVLDAKPEYHELAVNTIETDENMFNASPAISGGQLLVRTDSHMYCIGHGKVSAE
ncbi:MAG: PQQ-binding-like beta-propeller repeat protein [Pirellulaceae bacterium]|nr:PQQ-binding-like beta-propeller repeat protein [Pirellulaceae bacterium]